MKSRNIRKSKNKRKPKVLKEESSPRSILSRNDFTTPTPMPRTIQFHKSLMSPPRKIIRVSKLPKRSNKRRIL